MGGELGGERLPLPHQPRNLLFGLLALAGDGASALAIRVQRRVSQRLAEAGQALFQRVDLTLDVVEAPTEVEHLTTHARLRARARHGRLVQRRGAWRGRVAAGGR